MSLGKAHFGLFAYRQHTGFWESKLFFGKMGMMGAGTGDIPTLIQMGSAKRIVVMQVLSSLKVEISDSAFIP